MDEIASYRRLWSSHFGVAVPVDQNRLDSSFFMPTEQMGDASWRAINAATVVLAMIGILLALAFSMSWGERLPAWLVALPIWMGTGLLVPMLLLAPVLGPAAMTRDKEAGAADVWVYEQFFVMISLVGVGICLPLALAGYARTRWPEAFGTFMDYRDLPGNTLKLQQTLAKLVVAGCILLGTIKVFGLWEEPSALTRQEWMNAMCGGTC
ncbi:Uncharacterised protein [Actinobacillus pleuropneumoniae]|nr:Uncharacterised protein [Actinobacillus pleuropneumoniae]